MTSFADRFWARVRRHELVIRFFFVLDILFVILALAALPLVEPGSAAFVLVVIDLVIFVGLLVPITYILYKCRQLQLEEDQL